METEYMRKCTAVSTHGLCLAAKVYMQRSYISYLRDERNESLFDTLGVDSKAVQFGRPRAVAGERQTMASRGIGRGNGGRG